MPPPEKPTLQNPGGVVEFPFDAATFRVTEEMKQVFDYDGAILIKGLLSKDEVAKITKQLEMNDAITGQGWGLPDGEGATSRLVVWSHPGTDVTGMVARCNKVANTMEQLLGAEVYHYHTKLMMKDAKTGGKFLWHQDYGYWYKNGCLRPDMGTVFIPLDPCRKENGCLQVVKGTHRCGRIEHDLVAGQTAANPERVKWMTENFEHIYAEMDPGDGLFFHCNLLHTSDRNTSDTRRWCFLVAYNRADNNPLIEHHHPQYTPLHKVTDDSIMKCENMTDLSGKDFMDPASDKTTRFKKDNFH